MRERLGQMRILRARASEAEVPCLSGGRISRFMQTPRNGLPYRNQGHRKSIGSIEKRLVRELRAVQGPCTLSQYRCQKAEIIFVYVPYAYFFLDRATMGLRRIRSFGAMEFRKHIKHLRTLVSPCTAHVKIRLAFQSNETTTGGAWANSTIPVRSAPSPARFSLHNYIKRDGKPDISSRVFDQRSGLDSCSATFSASA